MILRTLALLGGPLAFAAALLPASSVSALEQQWKTAFACYWTDAPPKLDGSLDDPCWKHAETIDQFYTPWLKEPRLGRTATKARLLWDRDAVYFAAEMTDADLYADITDHDGRLWENDVFELFFKPSADHPGYYEFQVNPAGAILDLFIPRRMAQMYERFKNDGTFHIEAKVKLRGTLNKWSDRDEGWTVEGKIPWSDFLRSGGRPEPGSKWGFALCRYDYSVDFEGPDLTTCAPLKGNGSPNFHRFEEYATLRFVGPNDSPGTKTHGLKRLPLTGNTVVGYPDPPPPYRVERVYPDLKLNFPIAVVHQPGTKFLWAIEQEYPYAPTRIVRFVDEPTVNNVEEVLPTNKDTAYDICFHPQFATNGWVYVGSNGPKAGHKKHSRVTRYTVERTPPFRLDPASAVVILDWESDGHNGAAICFGNDGMMYVTTGDGTSDSDVNLVGQRLDTLLAKVLRIDVDHPEPGKMYAIPKDNPFLDLKNARPETFAYGLRNPWRITADRVSGQIWVAQNGQDLWEQTYLLTKGANYGWSVMEGGHEFYPNRERGPHPIVKPTTEHHHSEARSLTGGIVYRGSKLPELVGAYIYGDYSTGKIWGVKHDGTKVEWHQELTDSPLMITGFGADSRGELLIADHRGDGKGGFYRLVPTPKNLPPSRFPRKLSESGLFTSVAGHKLHPAVVPYSVNAPFWSDGLHKERAIALPTDGQIGFKRWRGWDFPDETVIIKSFALEERAGDPRSRRWIETRFLVKHENEWAGYSYLWNEAGTDAELVPANGLDKTFVIRDTTGERKQVWHYPSRAECMVCHSRAANFVLGLCEQQMNRDTVCGVGTINQLELLERLGMLKVNAAQEFRERLREAAKGRGLSDKDADNFVMTQTATRDQRPAANPSVLLATAPSGYKRLVDPFDATADLTKRVRSYLHSNCASCHVEAGGGNAKLNFDIDTPLEKVGIIDEKPQHSTFGLPEARLIAPGHPERSVLLHRISHRGEGHMPPLSTNVVDERAVALVREWIRSLPPRQ